jgi:hypothetical protein
MLTYIFYSFMQADVEPAVGEKWHCSLWHRAAFHGLEVQDVAGFDFD